MGILHCQFTFTIRFDIARTNAIEYYTWDEDEDGPIPGIKLFKDFNIYLEREYCEY